MCLAERLLRGEPAMEADQPTRETGPLRKSNPPHNISLSLTSCRWNPSSRTPYIADSERTAWDAGSKTPGRVEPWSQDSGSSSTTARTPGVYNAASPEFLAPYGASAPTPGNPVSAPTPSAPTPGPISAPTPAAWSVDTAPTPGASGGYGRGGGIPNTPGAWGADDDDAPRYAPPSP